MKILSYLITCVAMLFLSSCAERGRTQYLYQKDKDQCEIASPFVKKIISEKNGIILVDKLESAEQSAENELKMVRKKARLLNQEIKGKQKEIESQKNAQINQLQKEYMDSIKRIQEGLNEKIKEVENETQSKVHALNLERRKKEIKFVDSAKLKVLEKINQAEMDLFNKYIASKRKSTISPEEAQKITLWKRDINSQLKGTFDYLNNQLQDDKELLQILAQKQKDIERNIAVTQSSEDESYEIATHDLASLIIMKNIHQSAEETVAEAFEKTYLSDEKQQQVRLIIQAELAPFIQQAIHARKETSQDKINMIVTNAIGRVREPKAFDKVELDKKLAALKEQLEQESQQKLALEIQSSETKEKLAQVQTQNMQKIATLQQNLEDLKGRLETHINQQIELKKLLEVQKQKMTVSELTAQEKEIKIQELQRHLNKSTVSKFHAEIEAAKIKNLQGELTGMKTSLDNSRTKIKDLEEEREKEASEFKRKQEVLLHEKLLLEKELREEKQRLRTEAEKLKATRESMLSGQMNTQKMTNR